MSDICYPNVRLFRELSKGVLPEEVTEWCIFNGFLDAPAAAKHHGNHEGGLFGHSYMVAIELCDLTEKLGLKWQKERSPMLVGLMHDLCKIDQYVKDEKGEWHYQETEVKGHGDKSVIYLSELMELTEEEEACIRYHMGAFTDKEYWKDYTAAVQKFPNVMWTHAADMWASQIMQR